MESGVVFQAEKSFCGMFMLVLPGAAFKAISGPERPLERNKRKAPGEPGASVVFYVGSKCVTTGTQTTPWSIMESATFTKPAMLAPVT